MSVETWVCLISFVAVFPIVWLVALYWDLVWPDTTALLKRRGEPMSDNKIPE